MSKPTRVELGERIRRHDGRFKLDEYPTSFERFDGRMSESRNLLVFERGDAVAALVFDADRQEVFLTNQFRLPVHLRKKEEGGAGNGWMLELPAGVRQSGETAEQTIIRELREEVGVKIEIEDVRPIGKFFVSPGGTTEQISLFFVSARQPTVVGGGGNLQEGENIETVVLPIDALFSLLDKRELEDAKLIVAALWLRLHLSREPAEPQPTSRTTQFAFPGNSGRILGYKTGRLQDTGATDAWVNSENTDMLMDRFSGRSISATIRWLGAEKDSNDLSRIKKDVIQDALREEMGDRTHVRPGYVIETVPGEILKSHGVKGIFHVSTVQGDFGGGFKADVRTLENCMDAVLSRVEESKRNKYGSVLIPLLGTGQGGVEAKEAVPALVERAVTFYARTRKSRLREIYFLAFTREDVEVLELSFHNAGLERIQA